ncbi:Uncharacterized protein TCM_006544 [Theobroma cacao]|uniref:Uncharacterized protein n=1 Tax=Theobroma cacao TaxID=3641 RepID=A0A061DYR4_THECC|nr:Uncharacterized protein TCM_006544 [Theobroma cacao]
MQPITGNTIPLRSTKHLLRHHHSFGFFRIDNHVVWEEGTRIRTCTWLEERGGKGEVDLDKHADDPNLCRE